MPLPFAQASNARACFDCLKKLLSRDVFEQRTLTGREVFSLLVYLAATKLGLEGHSQAWDHADLDIRPTTFEKHLRGP